MNAIGYLRVSTRAQGDSNLGLEAQQQQIEKYCQANGLNLIAVFTDVISGGSSLDKRAGWMDAMSEMNDGVSLVVAKRDRIARDPLVSALAEKSIQDRHGVIVSAAGEGNGDDPSSVLMRRILDAFSEYERLMIKSRTRAALKAKRARGEKTGGGIPFGFNLVNGCLVENHDEQDVLTDIQSLRDREEYTFQQIANFLNERKIKTKSGRDWTRQLVRKNYARVANGTTTN